MALRIKDNVDLKELEKYGFKYNDYSGQYKICERNIDGAAYIYIMLMLLLIIVKTMMDILLIMMN